MSYDPMKMMDHLTVIRHEQTRLWRLYADKDYRAFAECLSRIDYAARMAGYQVNDLMSEMRFGRGVPAKLPENYPIKDAARP